MLAQDPNWSELVKYCAARGAYRGAGSESLGILVRNQPSEDSYLPGEDSGKRRSFSTSAVMLCPCCSCAAGVKRLYYRTVEAYIP